MENKYIFVGITKSKTAISDSFLDLVAEAPKQSVVLHGGANGSADYSDSVDSFRIGVNDGFFLGTIIELILVLIRLRISNRGKNRTLVAYSTLPVNWLVALILRPKRFFIWSHDPTPHSGESFYNSRIVPLDFKFCVNFLRADVICGSGYVESVVASKYPDVNVKNFHFPYISALVDQVEWGGESLRDIDLIFFGRMEEYKGIRVLLDALHILEKSVPVERDKVKIVFAGKGPLLDYVLGQRFGDLFDFEVVNFPSNSELSALLRRARYACFPYLDGTGSQVMQSALALGCYVICSRIPIFEEISVLVDEKYVSLCQPNDQFELASVLKEKIFSDSDNSSRKDLVSHAREKFSPKKWSATVAEFYA